MSGTTKLVILLCVVVVAITAAAAMITAGFMWWRAGQVVVVKAPLLHPTPPVVIPDVTFTETGPHSFRGSGGNTHIVVFVMDLAGKPPAHFEAARNKLLVSLSKLQSVISFSVLLAGDGTLEQTPKDRIVLAGGDNVPKAFRAVRDAQPLPTSDLLPAVKKAYELLDKAPSLRKGHQVFVLTTGDVSESVLKFVEAQAKAPENRRVHFFVYVFAPKSGEFPNAAKVCELTGGKLKRIEETTTQPVKEPETQPDDPEEETTEAIPG